MHFIAIWTGLVSLRRNIFWTFASNVVYAGCQWGILVALAKLTDARTVGEFALGMAITGPLFAFSNMNLRSIQATDVQDRFAFNTYFGFRLLTSAVALMVVLIMLPVLEYRDDVLGVIILVGLAKAIESKSDLCYGLFQRHEKMRTIAFSMMLKGPLSLLLVVTFLFSFSGSGAFVAATALTLSWLVVFVGFDLRHARDLQSNYGRSMRPSLTTALARQLFLLALPVAIVVLLNTLSWNIPRYVVSDLINEEALGYYAAIAYLSVAGASIVNAVGQSAMPRLARFYIDNREAYVYLLQRLLVIAVAVGIGGVMIAAIAGRLTLMILYTPAYIEYDDVFLWIMIGAGVSYCTAILGCGITAARCFKGQAAVTALSTVTLLPATLLLVASLGLVGAAKAVTISYMVKLAGQIALLRWLSRIGRGMQPLTDSE